MIHHLTQPPRPSWPRILGLLLSTAAIPCSQADDSIDFSAPVDTIDALWANYDPRIEPLEIETIRTWDEDGVRIEQLGFTGEIRRRQRVRVFAYRGVPIHDDGKFPGVLHIHGGGQTAVLDWIRFWGKRGYACVSFDFCGKHPGRSNNITTDWGAIDANMLAPVEPPTNLEPTPRHSAWFHWALICRRAITLLEQHPRVDRKRLGIFGISVGGTLTWIVAGVDSRVKAAVPIYGIGQNSYTFPWEKPEELTDIERRRFRDLLEPESYAARITCPILWLSSSNDHHGRLDSGMRTLKLAKTKILRQAYTPLQMHHVSRTEAANLPLWMDWHLKGQGDPWPASPKVKFQVYEPAKALLARITVDRPEDVTDVAWCWGLNNPWPTSRFYRVFRSAPKLSHGTLLGPVQLSSADDTVYAFVNVTYRSGVVLSSRLATFSAKRQQLHLKIRRTKLIDSMETDAAWYWQGAPTDPCNLPVLSKRWIGSDGEKGFATPLPVFQFATNILADPQWHGRGRQTLQIDLLTQVLPAKLEIEVAEKFFQPGSRSYTARPSLSSGEARWTTISLRLDAFTDSLGKALKTWDAVDFLLLRGHQSSAGPAVFRNLRWKSLED